MPLKFHLVLLLSFDGRFSGMDALPSPPAHGQLAEAFEAVQQAMGRRGEATDGFGDDYHPSVFLRRRRPAIIRLAIAMNRWQWSPYLRVSF